MIKFKDYRFIGYYEVHQGMTKEIKRMFDKIIKNKELKIYQQT